MHENTDAIDSLEHIRAGVFNGKELISREDLDRTFESMDKEIAKAMGYILNSPSRFVEYRLSEVAIKVIGNLTYGRVLYNKDKFANESEWLVLCGELLHLSSGNKTIENTNRMKQLLLDMSWVRAIYEELIEDFLTMTTGYNDLCVREAKLSVAMTGAFGTKISKIRVQKQIIEDAVGVDPVRLYGVVHGVMHHRNLYMEHRNAVIQPFLRLVFAEASKIAGPAKGILAADIFQAGVFGLMRAISTFFLEKQTYFSGYARWWVRQAILLSLKEEVSFFRIPSAVWNVFNKMERGEDIGQEPEKIRQYVDVTKLVPLDQPVASDAGTTRLSDTLVDTEQEDLYKERELNETIVKMLSSLDSVTERYICLHFGTIAHLPEKAEIGENEILREKLRQTLALMRFHTPKE